MLVSYCICVALMASYWVLVVHLNQRLVDVDPQRGEADANDLADAFTDRTDFQQKHFRYTT